ncbi:hypothetical protein Acr_00g0042560 [Actinidia rufa]|uniref:RNase H type-1 domain-containing protein n=1 Tax=Actinidia rufa TaxID=165716 RepID=A0A7J0DIG1_9ERIC|nr:hypothetical protein Acr_00g0042560 [Actinidia rufa]
MEFMEFNHHFLKANYKVWQPEEELVDHAPTPQSSPVYVHVDVVTCTTHRWINRPFDRGHSHLVGERRDPTVRLSGFIYARAFEYYPKSHAIIAGMLKGLRIDPHFHDAIIGVVFRRGRRLLECESNMGRTVIPLRVEIQIVRAHVRDEEEFARPGMRGKQVFLIPPVHNLLDTLSIGDTDEEEEEEEEEDVRNIKSEEIKGAALRQPRLVKWHFPMAGRVKLNTDACSKGNPGRASFGGVFRDNGGEWVMGFYGRLQDCASLEAELWGIYRGLKLIFGKDLKHVEIETDSEVAMKLLRDGPFRCGTPHRNLIEDCRELMRKTESSIKHTYREGNKVADRLANMGADQDVPMVLLLSPPAQIGDLLAADLVGIAHERP